MPRTRVLVTSLLVAVVAGACSSAGNDPAGGAASSLPSTTAAPRGNVDDQLVIGTLLPQSGEGAGLGKPMITGALMAVRDINAAGGVNGKQVVLRQRDEGADATSASLAVARLLTDDKVDAVIGPSSSKVALDILDATVRAKAMVCSPANTAIALSDYPSDGYYVRTAPSDALQAVALGTVIAESGRRSTAVLFQDDDYGRGMAQVLVSTLAGNGIKVTAKEPFDPAASDYAAPVSHALASSPEAVAIVGLAEPGARLLADLRADGATPGFGPSELPTYVTSALRISNLFDLVTPGQPGGIAGIIGTAPAPSPKGATWFTTELAQYAPDTPASYAAYAYDCVTMIALAAQSARSDDPTVFRAQLPATARGGALCHDFESCLPLVAQQRNIDLDGASGPIELSDHGDVQRGIFEVFQYGPDGKDNVLRQLTVSAP